jgi:hypothetical protein
MFDFVVSVLLLRRLGLAKPFRGALLAILAVLLIVVSIYTIDLFLTLDQRTGVHHVHSRSTY